MTKKSALQTHMFIASMNNCLLMSLAIDPQCSVLMLSWHNFKLRMSYQKINASVTKRRGFKKFVKESQTQLQKLSGWISLLDLQNKLRVVLYQQWQTKKVLGIKNNSSQAYKTKTWRKLERLLTVVTYKLMVKIKLLKRLLNRA